MKVRQRTLLGLLGAGVFALLAAPSESLALDACDAIGAAHGTVPANGCVKTSDIKGRAVSGGKLKPNILIGNPTNGGRVAIRTNVNPGALVFEAEGQTAGFNLVRIGRGGSSATNEDTDLHVIDPQITTSSVEPIFEVNASLGLVTIGSSADAGELILHDTGQITTVNIQGGSGDLTLGGGVDDGDLFVRDTSSNLNRTTVSANGSTGSINVGTTAENGEVFVRNSANATTITLSGSNGTITNSFSGNGVVKAWARIRDNGTVLSCYRCTASQTAKVGSFYEVDFTALSTDIRSRPRLVSVDSHEAIFRGAEEVELADRSGDTSSVAVIFRDNTGAAVNRAFTIVIF